MKKIFFISFILICIANNIYSQTVSIDESFGENGMVTMPSYLGVEFLDFDAQGNIIAFGYPGYPVILKTDANGIIDKHFGTNGYVILHEYWSNWGGGYGLKVTSENKILIVFLVYTHTSAGPDDPPKNIIMRLNEDGSIDESFGINGEIILDNITCVNTENDDYMLITSIEYYYDNNGYNQDPYISKYNYDGEMDTNFGANGKAYLTDKKTFSIFPNSIKILNDKSIIAAGYNGLNVAFCKLSQEGNFVTNFADNGRYISNIDNNPYAKHFSNVIEESNGNLFFIGRLTDHTLTHRFFVCGFNSNGTINSNFGENGFLYSDDLLNSPKVVLQNENTFLTGNGKKIISINYNGTLDTHFNNTGSFVFEEFSIRDMKHQTSSKFIVGGREGLVRLNISSEATSIKPNEISNSLFIFPNPVKDILIINNEQLIINNVKICDLLGRVVLLPSFGGGGGGFNVSVLPQGIYFVKLETDKETITKKFVKE